ncbi:MAG TPA: alpha-galactosidase [Symbiobacteriaceae bacterium]
MPIYYNEPQRLFHLQGPRYSYVMQVTPEGYLTHLYWGRRLHSHDLAWLLPPLPRKLRGQFRQPPVPECRYEPLETLPQEYPGYGGGDFRHPAYQVQLPDGSTVGELTYLTHRIEPGKPRLSGLPATYVESPDEAETLVITLADRVSGLTVDLTYTVFAHHDALARSARLQNTGSGNLKVLRALSAALDFHRSDFDFLHLSGASNRERYIERTPLRPGMQAIESRRGASSHQQNPFIALLSRDATEDHGEVYGFSLVYSGNFVAQAEVDMYHTTRVSMGINPFDFSWLLEPGESFQTPEVVMVYSDQGLGAMSRTYHDLYRTRLARGVYRDQVRPIVVNNWEATYFDFDAEKLESIARVAADLGIEVFVLDDGWFGHRDNDESSLGDWYVNTRKLPGGLSDLAKRVSSLGLGFGLWFEPEMISPDSDLYRQHPDWCLHVPGRPRTLRRHQLVLDFTRPEVRKAVGDMIAAVLRSAPIRYVKWDMNRNMTEIGSAALPPERQRETAHRYILGLYELLERLTTEFPHVLFESCAGGGGRFDPGMLYYMPQTWTSDNTDAIGRLKIQFGTSIVYPAIAMEAHVSAVPNHQVGRITPLETRGHVAMAGNFGYELDLTKLTEKERATIRDQVATYKRIRPVIQFGDLYRILSPFEGNEAAWIYVTKDKRQAVAFYVHILAEANPPVRRLRLKGLDPDRTYRIEGMDRLYRGDELMYAGLYLPDPWGDFQSVMWHLQAVDG